MLLRMLVTVMAATIPIRNDDDDGLGESESQIGSRRPSWRRAFNLWFPSHCHISHTHWMSFEVNRL
jgi:hypothetical protein